MTRASSDLGRNAVKTAARRLIAGLGGTDAASTVTRVVKSKLHEYGDANRPERHMPIDVLLDLETCLAQPIVTQELARQAGFLMIPMQFGEGDAGRALAEVAKDCGKTLADAMRALADNLPQDEVDLVLSDLAELSTAVNTAIAVLRGGARPTQLRAVAEG